MSAFAVTLDPMRSAQVGTKSGTKFAPTLATSGLISAQRRPEGLKDNSLRVVRSK